MFPELGFTKIPWRQFVSQKQILLWQPHLTLIVIKTCRQFRKTFRSVFLSPALHILRSCGPTEEVLEEATEGLTQNKSRCKHHHRHHPYHRHQKKIVNDGVVQIITSGAMITWKGRLAPPNRMNFRKCSKGGGEGHFQSNIPLSPSKFASDFGNFNSKFWKFSNFQNFGKKFPNSEFFLEISKTTEGPPMTSKGPPPPY